MAGINMNRKQIRLLLVCAILALVIVLCALVMSREYTSQIISQEKLYGSFGENLKDFVESNGNLIAQSADPWINCDLDAKGRIACIEIDVDCLDAKGSSCQIFDTDTWQSYRKNLHEGRNYIYLYNSELEWNSQHLRLVSKLNTFSDGFKVIRTIIKLFRDYRPLAFFGLLSALLVLISAIFFVPVFVEYLHTGLVLRFPTLIVCGFMTLSAIISLFSGLMLSAMRQKDRQEFEYLLIELENRYNLAMIR